MSARALLLAAGLSLAAVAPGAAQVRIVTTPPRALPEAAIATLSGYRERFLEQIGIPSEIAERGETFRWLLDNGGLYEIELAVESGEVAVLAVCDDDCADLDLAVYSEADAILGKDDMDDAFPLVKFAPEGPGRFVVRVGMAACSLDPCYFEVLVLSSVGGAPKLLSRRR